MTKPPLPRRDLWLLPLVSVMTLVSMCVTAELGARIFYAEQPENSCKVPDRLVGGRYVPDCTATEKAAEGPWVTEHYNAYGFRASQSWTPFPPKTTRIALIGTSFADGLFVPYEETAGATLAASLQSACHQPVEVLIAGSYGFTGHALERRLKDTLALKPQVALFMFSARDLLQITQQGDEGEDIAKQPAQPSRAGLLPLVRGMVSSSRLMTVVQHFLFRNRSWYIPMYLRNGDTSDFLRAGLTPSWKQRVASFAAEVDRLDELSKSAGATLALLYVPLEPQAVLASQTNTPRDEIDPFALGAAIGDMAAKRGVEYHDGTSDFAVLADPQDAYYTADGHLAGKGQSIVGADVAQQFQHDLPMFARCKPTPVAANSVP